MKNEAGRSMVEMLGVIAIMGVLSLGGIAGYTLAINRYKANQVIDVAGKLAGMGMGGTTYNSLKAAGLEAPQGNIDMFLNKYGVVCVEISGNQDLYDAVEAQSLQFKCSGDHCGNFKCQSQSQAQYCVECNGIMLDFKKKNN